MNRSIATIVAVFLAGQLLAAQDQAEPASNSIKLTVDYGDGVEKRFTRIAWKTDMTVQSAIEAAQKHPRGIRFKHRGKGATAFLFEIDGLKNERGGRGWLFRVNGKRADRSFAIAPLKVGDSVLWEFGSF
jgi:hypothetical protein